MCEVLMAVKMWLAVVWVKALCSVVGAFIDGSAQKMEAAGNPNIGYHLPHYAVSVLGASTNC